MAEHRRSTPMAQHEPDPWCTARGWLTGSVKLVHQRLSYDEAGMPKNEHSLYVSPKLRLRLPGSSRTYLAKCPPAWPEKCLRSYSTSSDLRQGHGCSLSASSLLGVDDSAFAEVGADGDCSEGGVHI